MVEIIAAFLGGTVGGYLGAKSIKKLPKLKSIIRTKASVTDRSDEVIAEEELAGGTSL